MRLRIWILSLVFFIQAVIMVIRHNIGDITGVIVAGFSSSWLLYIIVESAKADR